MCIRDSGKGSLLGKMPGDQWQRFANLRMLFGYMYGQPGKKLLFMGAELGQDTEWDHDRQLNWDLLDDERHEGIRSWVEHLNRLHRSEPALHELDCDPNGFAWIDASDVASSVVSFLRLPRPDPGVSRPVLVVANFTPIPRDDYRIGVPVGGAWEELANSDAKDYGGSGWGNMGAVDATPDPMHGQPFSLPLVLPPLSLLMLAPRPAARDDA